MSFLKIRRAPTAHLQSLVIPTDEPKLNRRKRVIAKLDVQFEEYQGEEAKFLICLHSYQDSRKRCCVCDSMDDGSKFWSYDVCHERFHPECLGYSSTESAPDPFMCHSCLSKTPMRITGGKSMETKKQQTKRCWLSNGVLQINNLQD